MASLRLALLAFATLLAATTLACGGASAPTATNGGLETSSATVASSGGSGSTRDVHSIYDSRCGNCHVRVEPGTRTRTQLETAFSRHRKRVKMNDAEWSSMVDFLASDSATSAKSNPVSAEK